MPDAPLVAHVGLINLAPLPNDTIVSVAGLQLWSPPPPFSGTSSPPAPGDALSGLGAVLAADGSGSANSSTVTEGVDLSAAAEAQQNSTLDLLALPPDLAAAPDGGYAISDQVPVIDGSQEGSSDGGVGRGGAPSPASASAPLPASGVGAQAPAQPVGAAGGRVAVTARAVPGAQSSLGGQSPGLDGPTFSGVATPAPAPALQVRGVGWGGVEWGWGAGRGLQAGRRLGSGCPGRAGRPEGRQCGAAIA